MKGGGRTALGRLVLPRLVQVIDEYRFVPAHPEVRTAFRAHVNQPRRLVYLSSRFMTRTYAILTPKRRQYRRSHLIGLHVAGTLFDAVVWAKLRRPEEDGWSWRAPFYGVDAAAWSRFGPNGHFDSIPALMLWPFAVDVTLNQNDRRGSHQLLTLLTAAPILIDGLRRRARVPLKSWRWIVVAMAAATALRIYARRYARENESRLSNQLDLARSAAASWGRSRARLRIAGPSETGRDWSRQYDQRLEQLGRADLVDEMEALRSERDALANDPEPNDSSGPRVRFVHTILRAWTIGVRLQFVLDDDEWEDYGRDPRKVGPNVRFSYPSPGAWWRLVTPSQAVEITRALASLTEQSQRRTPEAPGLIPPPSADDVTVSLSLSLAPGDDARPPGAPFTLVLRAAGSANADEWRVEVSGDEDLLAHPTSVYDPSPLAFALAATWTFNEYSWSGSSRRLSAVATASSAAMLGGTMLIQRTGGTLSRSALVAAGIGVQAVSTLGAVRSPYTSTKSDGSHGVPAVLRAELPLLLLSAGWNDLTRRRRALAGVAILAIAAAGSSRPRGRWTKLDVLLEALFMLQVVPPSFRIGTWSFDALEARLGAVGNETLHQVADRAELEYAEELLRRDEQVYREVTRLLALSSEDVEDFHAQAREHLALLAATIEGARPRDGFEALDRIDARTARLVVLDVENTLVPYGSTSDERAAALARAVRIAETRLIPALAFVTNAPFEMVAPASESVDVICVSRARKPNVWLPPLRRHRSALAGAIVIGDQPLTDGQLASRLGGRFVEVEGFVNRATEPAWPKLLRRVARLLE